MTKEPLVVKNATLVYGAEDPSTGERQLVCSCENAEDARRIVACVNACVGWPTEVMELANAKGTTIKDTMQMLLERVMILETGAEDK